MANAINPARIYMGRRAAAAALQRAASAVPPGAPRIDLATRNLIPDYEMAVQQRMFRRIEGHADRSYYRDMRAGRDDFLTFTGGSSAV